MFLSALPALVLLQEPHPPAPPRSGPLPRTARVVRTTAALERALAYREPLDIVLDAGTYRRAKPLTFETPHRLWSRKPGRAVLKFGLVFGGPSARPGAELHGLTFDLEDPGVTFQGACVNTWGAGKGLKIEDCTFYGHKKAGSAILARQPDGLVVRRVVVRDFTSYGIFADQNRPDARLEVPVLIEDADVRGVSRSKPRSSKGTAEAGIWLGNRGRVRRVRVRDCSWMGIWTGTACTDSILEDLDVDDCPTGVGVYIEHTTRRTTFRRFHVGAKVKIGFVGEWDYGRNKPASIDNVIEDGLIEAMRIGVYLDQGSLRTVVRRVVFRRSRWGGIGFYRSPSCRYEDCTFELPKGVQPFRRDHWSAPPK